MARQTYSHHWHLDLPADLAGEVLLTIDPDRVEALARRALRSKRGRARAGPFSATVTTREPQAIDYCGAAEDDEGR